MHGQHPIPERAPHLPIHPGSGLAALAAMLLVAACGGGGGGGDTPAASPPAAAASPAAPPAAAPAQTPTASCPTPTLAAVRAIEPAAVNTAPVERMIVKLRAETQDAASTVSTATAALRRAAAPDPGTRMAAVIARIAHDAPAAGAAASAPARPARALSDGATLLSLTPALDAASAAALARRFAADPEVAYAEPDLRVAPRALPTDPEYPRQWNLFDPVGGIDLPDAWRITTGAPTAVVAVLDTGYLPHPDLAANLLPGYDFITSLATANNGHSRGADATDPGDWVTSDEFNTPGTPFYNCIAGIHNSTWHGTQMAGIIGAAANNGIGIAGISSAGRILPVRVLGKCGGAASDVVDAMRWAAGLPVAGVAANPYPARVLNLSFGGEGPCGTTFQQAIDDVTAQGVSVVVAVGNSGSATALDTPANCRGVIAVGATDALARRASYSNFSDEVTLSAPGSQILSTSSAGLTTPGPAIYDSQSGTSYAAAQVAGVVGLMVAANPTLTPARIAAILVATARPGAATRAACPSVAPPGAGVLDAAAALRMAVG
jgi:serine protease